MNEILETGARYYFQSTDGFTLEGVLEDWREDQQAHPIWFKVRSTEYREPLVVLAGSILFLSRLA